MNSASSQPAMKDSKGTRICGILGSSIPPLEPYQSLYRHFHANPDLSGLETQTAVQITAHLRKFSSPSFVIYERIGGNGVVAVLENGVGNKVLLRADMDGLPIEEKTGLPYASIKTMLNQRSERKPVAHACGHDVHITTLLAASHALHSSVDQWAGTLIVLFQPAEEDGSGAKAMISDSVYQRIGNHIPDILLAGHVVPAPAGFVALRKGAMTSNSDSLHITIYGRGGHASLPEATIDPVVLASHIVIRLQTIVSREVGPGQSAVVTVGSLQAGEAENVIPSYAVLKVNIRSFSSDVRARVLKSVRRIVDAECQASGCEKDAVFERTLELPMTWNDERATKLLSSSFEAVFGSQRFVGDIDPIPGSEDFSHLATAIGKPCVYWVYGSINPSLFAPPAQGQVTPVAKATIPANHSPHFAPEIEKTLGTAVESYVAAALTWLL